MIRLLSLLLLVGGSVANAIPSPSALHPLRALLSLNENDLAGSGEEIRVERRAQASSTRDDSADDTSGARHWQRMAERCRSLARWQNEEDKAVLLRLAEDYEARAKVGGPKTGGDNDAA
jgi:hypothetical protein